MLIVLDHAASAVNLQALREGSLNELLHLVPLGGVRLTYRELRLVGVDGLAALGERCGLGVRGGLRTCAAGRYAWL